MNDRERMNRRELLRRVSVVLGASLSAPAVLGILNGCSAQAPTAAAPEQPPGRPQSLTVPQLALVAEVADIMIPATDTPGARDVGVPAFIDTMLTEVYPALDRRRYLAGLDAFAAAARRSTGSEFLALPPAQRRRLVQEVHDAALATDPHYVERPFILMTKELTLLGYFTSEAGATRVLQYQAIPGAYYGCQPLDEAGNGRTWATEQSLPF